MAIQTPKTSLIYRFHKQASKTFCPACFLIDVVSTTCNHLNTWGLGFWLAHCDCVKTILLVSRQKDLRTKWPWRLSAVCSGHTGNAQVSLPCVVGFLMVLEDVLTLKDSELASRNWILRMGHLWMPVKNNVGLSTKAMDYLMIPCPFLFQTKLKHHLFNSARTWRGSCAQTWAVSWN